MSALPHSVRVIDSHTEGEPTRVVLDGAPDLGGGTVAEQARVFRERFDAFRSAVVCEPRGHDALVGALVVPPKSARSACGVIFFNNVGLLNACGHGTIGLAATLAHLGRIGAGRHVVETPVGDVAIELGADGSIAIDNVASFRHAKGVAVEYELDGQRRRVHGDVAWGGNWFFLVDDHGEELALANLERLTNVSWAIRRALERAGVAGATDLGGGVIDHVELFGAPQRADCDSRNFVLCPGKAYDRSPCGTGTSAKVACLVADGKLAPGAEWRQESILGSRFVARAKVDGARVLPTISGTAFVTAESTLLFDPRDPFREGIRA
ncbi:MAG: proline racemase family protein [Planctomycetes bacterium]|nr:proline racemase family protein [Planctomycetota bacterium]